jgi:uridylate kinase
MPKSRYRRILVKLSGESLQGPAGAFDATAIAALCAEVKAVRLLGVQVAAVIGGGNIIRGRDLRASPAIQRVTADYMGMLATVINGIALRDSLVAAGVPAVTMSAIADPRICEAYSVPAAVAHLEAGKVVVLSGGTGNPYFTTDTGAALRAIELGADVLMKSTTVDGVYSDDPRTNPRATRYDKLTYAKVLADRLGVMDLSAVAMCMDNRLPVMVFRGGKLAEAAAGQPVGTVIAQE